MGHHAVTTRWWTTLSGHQLDEVRALADTVAAADGVAAYSETVMLDLSAPVQPAGTRHLLARDGDGTLLGYAHLDETDTDDRVVEMAVDPAHRRGGLGTAVADALRAEARSAGWPAVRAWAHGDHPAAARLAARAGLGRARELWMMRRGRSAGPLPQRPLPDGVVVRPLRVGVDEAAVVAVNNRAFAWHPEQGGWTVDEVAVREAEPWFDPEGFLLAWDGSAPEPGELLGFHWTKVHPRSASVPEPLGEVYVLGVDPRAQGRGLGSALTLAGLHHLASRGLDTVVLYVEADNTAAVATYRRLGFSRAVVDVSYGADLH